MPSGYRSAPLMPPQKPFRTLSRYVFVCSPCVLDIMFRWNNHNASKWFSTGIYGPARVASSRECSTWDWAVTNLCAFLNETIRKRARPGSLAMLFFVSFSRGPSQWEGLVCVRVRVCWTAQNFECLSFRLESRLGVRRWWTTRWLQCSMRSTIPTTPSRRLFSSS